MKWASSGKKDQRGERAREGNKGKIINGVCAWY